MTPSLFSMLVSHEEDLDLSASKLRLIILGGEPINLKDIQTFTALN